MDKTLVAITGASSGIGEAYARRLAPDHDLLLIARRRDRLQSLADELAAKHGCRAEVLTADLANAYDLGQVADRIASEPALALLINNAGFGTNGRFWEADWAGQEAMLNLHVVATARLTHAALRNMVSRDFGAIVNMASVAAFVRGPGSACYSSSKSWVAAFTETIYLELRGKRSRVIVQALCPGYTYSEFHDRLGLNRAKIASAAWWHSAEDVVEQSIDGLRRRKLFVMPGWRYRAITAILTRVPLSWRLFLELNGPRGRSQTLAATAPPPQIGQ
jgi:short-subunit dehydrogenase